MTIKELYDSVAQLGFETSLEDTSRFYLAANRSIKQINRIRPNVAIVRIDHYPLENKSSNDAIKSVPKLSAPIFFYAENVKSYYFEADGTGVATIEMQDKQGNWATTKVITLIASRQFEGYRGKILNGEESIKGIIRITFSGEFAYNVRNVAFYENLYSNDDVDIPAYGVAKRYNISILCKDFLAFCCPPLSDGEGNYILDSDYSIENKDTILLSHSLRGSFNIKYERKVKSIDDLGEYIDAVVIDLDDELSALLPLLVAAYIWADDEPAKAEFYLGLYREQEYTIRSRVTNINPILYKGNGW